MPTISADLFVAIDPSVVAAGGSALDLNGLVLTSGTQVPIGTVASFGDAQAVQDYFGGGSKELQIAQGGVGLGSGYFGGFDTSTVKPAAILFAQYPVTAVPAYLRGGNVSSLTLSQLQAFSGTLGVVIDGSTKTSSVNLSAVTSFTNAAQLIQTDLAITGVAAASFTGAITGSVLTASSVTGVLKVGQLVAGATVASGTFISSFGTGTGGVGTYNLTTTAGSPITNESMTTTAPAVVFDSVSGAFVIYSGTAGGSSTVAFATGAMATDLKLTSALGAVVSPGAAAAVPATFMNNLIKVTKNWASFMTSFDPDGGSGITQKLAFAAWNNSQNQRYVYVAWDTTPDAATVVPATDSLSYAINQASYSGTAPVWEISDTNLAAMLCGFIASINFDQAGGRIAFAYKKQAGMTPSVTDDQSAINLGGNPQVAGDRGNGYNYYGAIGTANQDFIDFQRGIISGPFLWLDTYVDEIWMTNQFQLALMDLFEQVNSIPFNAAGDALIEAALADPIQAALTFGAIQSGVTLSNAQIAAINALAGGTNIASTIGTQGWYLLVSSASASVRSARGPRAITFFYTDGQSVQSINLSSIAVL